MKKIKNKDFINFSKILKFSTIIIFLFVCIDNLKAELITFEYINPKHIINGEVPPQICSITLDIEIQEDINTVKQRIREELEKIHKIKIPNISIYNLSKYSGASLYDSVDWNYLKTCKLSIWIYRDQLLNVNPGILDQIE
ncbi:MAG: hypothetical protein WC436_01160 [Candidatus Babeliales bacterium]